MFYEQNTSLNNDSSRRPTCQQISSIPSTTKSSNGLTNISAQQVSSTSHLATEQMQRSKSYKDLLDPSIVHPIYYQQQSSSLYPSASHYTHNTTPMIVGSMLENGPIDYHQHQPSLSVNNFISDDISTSSVGHLPKPPPGIPSQNAR